MSIQTAPHEAQENIELHDHDTQVDAKVLAAQLRAAVSGEVRFDDGSRALYATDGSNYRQVPIGVVVPRSAADVEATVALCREFGAPILGRGGGTSLTGGCCNVAVVLDFSKYMNQLLELNPAGKFARVQPGIVLDKLRMAAEEHELTFAPDPSTHNHCCLGGMMGNNSCGIHSIMGGRTVDNIQELEILTYDGLRMRVGATSDEEYERIVSAGGRRADIYRRLRDLRDRYGDLIRQRYPKIPRRVSGYSLDELLPENGFNVARSLIGSESTCVLFLEATCRLIHSPPKRTLVVIGFPDVATAGDHVPDVLTYGPVGLEGLDDHLINDMRAKSAHMDLLPLLPEGDGWLLVEFGGDTKEESDAKADALMRHLAGRPHVGDWKIYTDKKEERLIWEIREAGLGATARIPNKPDNWEGWEDSAVPPEKVGDYLRDLRKLLDKYGYQCALYGHFGQGCIHTRINFQFKTVEGVAIYRRFMYEAADLVLSYGGSLSGEHGDGQSRAELLPKMYGPELIEAFREFKSIWDPDWKMNPGKKVDAYKISENLRLGPTYHPLEVETHFKFPHDHGSFAYATERCVSVGTCRREKGGTMCPSYMVTKEEKDSTRGRAHLLFEMLQGDPLKKVWKNEAVHDALDLCLACKGCKGDCPMQVDMATYKAEFLSHYYEGRLRPRHAYAFGWIYWWSRLASLAPPLVNFFSQTPGLSAIAKWLGGVSQHRQMPPFANQSFKEWFFQRKPRNVGAERVILWPDTFNNYLHPEVAKAAVEVLEEVGWQVVVPRASLCCGRPLYDYGMLDTAKRMLKQILTTLQDEIQAGTPVVGLEPSCVAVFRDELLGLYPMDEDAKRLKQQTFTLAEFIEKYAPEHRFPLLRRKAIVHGHCHHKAIMKLKAEDHVLTKLGLNYEVPETGCCGMAGSFGFEEAHYDISMKVGEHKLLPTVMEAEKDTLIVADGFSCKHQIMEGTDRRALHLAQVIQMALHEAPDGPSAGYPEVHYPDVRLDGPEKRDAIVRSAIVAGVGILAAAGAFYLAKRTIDRLR
ncbi:MAG TPA: FAD-linked oxidase C-terminal domain-containing protein [Pirellulales bacterium]|nr:FAD-linked oxidase C-terminal domain-containing protein [Pirellulales bacterium]